MTPPPPGQQATAERHAALTPLLDRVFPLAGVFPLAECDFTVADAQNYGRRQPTVYGSWSQVA